MEDYKLFVQRIWLVGIINLLVALSNIILIPILTKTLAASGYGIWVQITTTITLITSFTSLGLPNAMLIYLSTTNDNEKIIDGFYSILFTVTIFSMVISILLLFFAYIAGSIFWQNMTLLIYVAAIVFFASLNTILINYFRTFQNMKLYSIFLLIQTYLGVLIASLVAFSGRGIVDVTFGLLISYLISFIIMLVIIFKDLGFMMPKFRNIRKYLSFSLPTIPGNLSYWIVNSSDRYIIGIFLGVAYVGYYNPAYTLSSLIIMILFPFSLLLPAILPKYYEDGEINEIRRYLKYSIKYFLFLSMPCAIWISLFSKPILMILTNSEIALEGYMVTPFVATSSLFFGVYAIISNILILKKKTKIIGFIWVVSAAINLFLTLFLVIFFGILGAAISTMISFFIALLLTWYWSIKIFEFDFCFLPKIILPSFLMTITLIMFYSTTITDILLVSSMAVIVYLATFILLKGISIEEIKFIRELIKL